jgi:hypothetical protein
MDGIKEQRFDKLRSRRIERPVPVGLSSAIVAILSQQLLVVCREEAVPWEEVTLGRLALAVAGNALSPTTK